MTDSFSKVLLTAMDNAREGITISDATLPDNPLIYVNKGFMQMTGYYSEEVIGKNCRFLQGAERAQEALSKIREAICKAIPVQVELLNYHKNGMAFYNRLSITPVVDGTGMLTHFIGVQEDISEIKEKEAAQQKVARQQLIHQITVQAQEQERENIGKELHDNINQLLATSRLFLNMSTATAFKQKELMQKSSDIINEAIEEVRKLSKRLVQPELSKISLDESLRNMVQNLQPALPFKISFTAEISDQKLSDTRKLMFYRIAQEQLNNIIKYAKPSCVSIKIYEKEGAACLLIKDDGVGFDKDKLSKGIGLRNISNRLEMESGLMELDTTPGNGCTLHVSVPV